MSLPASAILSRLQSRLKLRHIQALLALAELRSMGRAAEALGMTQPAMSQLVAEMERLIEAPLFLRHSRGVDPTETAQDLLPIARRIVSATEEGAERIALRQRRDGGLVRVGSTAAATGALLDRTLPIFGRSHPGVQVQAATLIGQSLDAAFASGEYDIVCCRHREVLPDGWTFVACAEDDLVPVCAPSHPLAGKLHVTRAELGRQTWLQNHVSTVARRAFDDLVAREGWTDVREVHIQTRVALLIWSMLRGSDYVTLVPRSVAMPFLSEGLLSELPTQLGLQLGPLGYLWRPEHAGPATRHFANALAGD